MNVDAVETPAVLVDLDVVERNIAAMAERARRCAVRLRPHAKTHKIVEIGRMQVAAGASGLSVAKTSEAEVFAAAGFGDLFVAYPVVGADKGRRLLALADRVKIAVGVDSSDGARTLDAVFRGSGRRLDVLLKVDVGFHRVGVSPERAAEAAQSISALSGLRLRGVFTHAGHAYLAESPEGIAEVGRSEGLILVETAQRIRDSGIEIEEVSVGSTPTAGHAMAVPGVTSCRPGNNVYHDATQVSLGTCALEDCALTVLATVISVPASDRAVVDAGSKTLSSDPLRPNGPGFGFVVGRRSRVARLSEEHGVIDVLPGESFRVGERVRILPNHACVVSNLHDHVVAIRAGVVEGELAVAARGRVQ
jgi:D-serine deaminase-like pyridoxal phosphate-dependent protein